MKLSKLQEVLVLNGYPIQNNKFLLYNDEKSLVYGNIVDKTNKFNKITKIIYIVYKNVPFNTAGYTLIEKILISSINEDTFLQKLKYYASEQFLEELLGEYNFEDLNSDEKPDLSLLPSIK